MGFDAKEKKMGKIFSFDASQSPEGEPMGFDMNVCLVTPYIKLSQSPEGEPMGFDNNYQLLIKKKTSFVSIPRRGTHGF